MIVVGRRLLAAYVGTRGRNEDAILDLKLLKIPTFFSGVVGGLLFRIGIGALPFLLPLLLQIGFGLTPFQSGSLTFATAARRDGDEVHRLDRAPLVRLPPHADRQRADFGRVSWPPTPCSRRRRRTG